MSSCSIGSAAKADAKGIGVTESVEPVRAALRAEKRDVSADLRKSATLAGRSTKGGHVGLNRFEEFALLTLPPPIRQVRTV